jgi:hypothetical protein
MFLRATSGRRFHESWAIIQLDLTAAGKTPLKALAFYNGCLRYTKARSSGEPGAVGFQQAAIDAITAHRAEIDACNSLSEAAEKLEKWVPTGYEHRAGAIYVESFEAIK